MSLMEDWEVLANQYNTDQATAQKVLDRLLYAGKGVMRRC